MGRTPSRAILFFKPPTKAQNNFGLKMGFMCMQWSSLNHWTQNWKPFSKILTQSWEKCQKPPIIVYFEIIHWFYKFLHFSHDWVNIFKNGFQFCVQWFKLVHWIPINPIFKPNFFLALEGGLKNKMAIEGVLPMGVET